MAEANAKAEASTKAEANTEAQAPTQKMVARTMKKRYLLASTKAEAILKRKACIHALRRMPGDG